MIVSQVTKLFQERSAKKVLLTTPTGKRHKGRDCISDLAWSRLGVEPAELSEIAVDREVFQDLLGLLPPRKSRYEY